MNNQTLFKNRFQEWIFIIFLFTLLSSYVTYEQATSCIGTGMDIQLERHNRFMAGEAEFFNPWQYRILSEYVLESVIWVFKFLPMAVHPYLPYFFLKFLLNLMIFFAAYGFYRVLKIENKLLLLTGIMIVAFNMSNSNWQADLAFNTYFDILFYLLAGYVILKNKPVWILPITFFAALNRETSGFIPFMLIITAIDWKAFAIKDKRRVVLGGAALIIFLTCFIATRWYFGLRPYHGIQGIDTSMEFLYYNLTFFKMYPQLIGTFGIVPLLAFIAFRSWPDYLKALCFLIVPAWVIIHLIKSLAMETRLFLVPEILIFIPALLFIIEKQLRADRKKLVTVEDR